MSCSSFSGFSGYGYGGYGTNSPVSSLEGGSPFGAGSYAYPSFSQFGSGSFGGGFPGGNVGFAPSPTSFQGYSAAAVGGEHVASASQQSYHTAPATGATYGNPSSYGASGYGKSSGGYGSQGPSYQWPSSQSRMTRAMRKTMATTTTRWTIATTKIHCPFRERDCAVNDICVIPCCCARKSCLTLT